MLEHPFWHYSGLAFWGLFVLYLILRLLFGKYWFAKAGLTYLAGKGLMESSKKMVKEMERGALQRETLTEVGVNIFWRLTRIGIIGLLIAGLPIWLLMQQKQFNSETE